MVKINTELTKDRLAFTLPNEQGEVWITDTFPALTQAVTLVYAGGKLTAITTETTAGERFITIQPSWELEPQYLAKALLEHAQANGLLKTAEDTTLPEGPAKAVATFLKELLPLLDKLGYLMEPAKKKPAKAQHRWAKAVSTIAFHVNRPDSQATVYWQKRNEMLIKAGAKMATEVPLNKDGSVGFSARFAQKLRDEHATKFTDFVTTEDIILKSVNEVGLFLYFGGTNSWLELLDDQGKSIDEWTVVK